MGETQVSFVHSTLINDLKCGMQISSNKQYRLKGQLKLTFTSLNDGDIRFVADQAQPSMVLARSLPAFGRKYYGLPSPPTNDQPRVYHGANSSPRTP